MKHALALALWLIACDPNTAVPVTAQQQPRGLKYPGPCTVKYTSLEGFTRFAYDEAGQKVREEVLNAEGEISKTTRLTYDRHGNVLTVTPAGEGCRSLERGCSSSSFEYTYDADGRVLTGRMTGRFNGYRWRNVYSDGLLTEKTVEPDDDLESPTKHTFHYDSDERLALEEQDHEVDGSMDLEIRYSYDDAGNLVRQEPFDHYLGRILWPREYTYDEWGNVLTSSKAPGPGPLELSEIFGYECWQIVDGEAVFRP